MPIRVNLEPTFADVLAHSNRPLVGMWVCTGSPLVAEICAGSGLDWLLIDAEHSPNGLESILAQLQAVYGYPTVPLVRPPANDTVVIKQCLDLGAQNLLLPMIDTVEQAQAVARAVQYPPVGDRGIGSALARAARFNRVDGYLARARETISVFVQIETAKAVRGVSAIAAVDGIDGIFVGPADLAGSMGLLGQQDHPDVVAAVKHCIHVANELGKPVGVNAFAPVLAREYLDAGADYILVGADVTLLARGSERLAVDFIGDDEKGPAR